MMAKFLSRLGPGVVFAAMAIGVSHLVQATRSGAGYGLSLTFFVLLASALKYPLFKFACTYSAATGKTLLARYRTFGPVATALVIISVSIDMFISTAAVSLVTAGIIKEVFSISTSDVLIVIVLVAIIFALLLSSSYRFFEKFIIIIAMVFTIMTLFAAGLVTPKAIESGVELFPALDFSPALLLFLIAMAGWMPNPPSLSFILSTWSVKRRLDQGTEHSVRAAEFDFDFGYVLTMIVAVAFVLLGAVVLYLPGVTVETGSAVEFSGNFMQVFTESIGAWAFPIMGGAAIFVMFSTMMTIFEGAPRTMRTIVGADENSRLVFFMFFIAQFVGVSLIIVFFTSSFGAFINVATSLSFATAPFIAFLNHRAIMSEEVPENVRPGKILRAWSVICVVALAVIGAYYFSSKFGLI